MSQEKNLKNLVWILIIIILLVVSFIVYDKVLSVDKDVTPVEPELDTEVIEELEEKVEEAKDEDDDEVKELEEKVEDLEEKVEDLEEEAKEEEKEEAVAYEGENFINLISPNDGAGFSTEPIEFTGEVSPNTEKIVVTATGGNPDCNADFEASYGGTCAKYINDTYTLASFELGDDSFIYRVKYEWDNLTDGTNSYTFTAHFDDGSTKSTELSIESYIGAGDIFSMISVSSPEDGAHLITASSVNDDNVTPLPIVFTGSVSANTTKIVVTAVGGNINCDLLDFQGPCIPYFKDVYTLQNFKHGDESFIYRADFQLDNLAMDKNTYTFTAHFDDDNTKSEQVTIYIEIEQ